MQKSKEIRKRIKTGLTLALLIFIANACNLPQGFPPALTPTPIFIQPEPDQQTETTPTPTILPSATYSPTITQQPSDTPTAAPVNVPPADATAITFKSGGTTAYQSGQIASTQDISYIISAAKDQTMIIGVSSSNNDVYLSIQGVQSGQTILSSSQQKTDWSGTLPATQDYLITLSTENPAVNYFLSLEIPANILFAPGTDSTTINGHLAVHQDRCPDIITHVGYLAYAAAGQTMTVNITSPNIDSLSLGIYGQSDGQPYKRYEVKGTSGTLELPLTQGYYINVYGTGGVSTDFTMDVSIK